MLLYLCGETVRSHGRVLKDGLLQRVHDKPGNSMEYTSSKQIQHRNITLLALSVRFTRVLLCMNAWIGQFMGAMHGLDECMD